MLGEDRLLHTLDESVGRGVTRLNPHVANAERHADAVELSFELTAAIRQHSPPVPAGPRDR